MTEFYVNVIGIELEYLQYNLLAEQTVRKNAWNKKVPADKGLTN